MTNNEKIEPIFVTAIPKEATLVGRVVEKEAYPVDTAIEGSSEDVWHRRDHEYAKRSLTRKAAEDYKTREGERLFLIESLGSSVQFGVAGIQYYLSADVYKG
ncbi:MAG: hypothetical protein Q8R47_02110 [Nanoarchaeota archaeon]|nr:hypothetical protein [Nanoarchaeota archaeon]